MYNGPITEKGTIPLMTDQKLLKLSSLLSPARKLRATFMPMVLQLIQFNLTIHTFELISVSILPFQ